MCLSIWYSGIKLRNYAAACPDEQIAAYVFDVLRTGRPADILYGVGEPEEKIVLEDVEPEESTNYYRDEQDVHYVPKRKLKDIVFTAEKK